MRPTVFVLALSVFASAGCSSMPSVPPAPHDPNTPVSLEKPIGYQRVIEQRKRAGEVAQAPLAVEGQLVR